MAIPLLWPAIPPLIDLPSHMGRYRIALDLQHASPLARYFTMEMRLLPNQGIDLLTLAIAPLLGLELSVKLIVIAIPMLTVAGFLWIAHEAHGRIPPTALFALPLAYGYPFQFGFVNYTLAAALVMIAFALWLRLGREGRWLLRSALFALIAPVICLVHVFGWGMLGLLAFASEAVRQHRDGRSAVIGMARAAMACVPLMPLVALLVLWRQGSNPEISAWLDWLNWLLWTASLLRDRWIVFDLASAGIVFALLGTALLMRRWFTIDWLVGLPALLVWGSFLLLPNLMFGSYYASVRAVPFAAALSVLSVRPGLALTTEARQRLATFAIGFLAVRLAAHTISFAIADRDYREQLQALDHIATGSRVVAFVGANWICDWEGGRLRHLPSMAIIRRSAFANDQWQISGVQALHVTYSAAEPFRVDPSQDADTGECRTGKPNLSVQISRMTPGAFDYLWIIDIPQSQWPTGPGLTRLWSHDRSVLYRFGGSGAGNAR